MAVTINASTTTGLVQTADTSGVLQLQTNSGTTAVTIDTSQNVGIGVTPSAWGTSFSQKALQISSAGSISGLNAGTGNQQISMANNVYFDGSNWKYISSDAALLYTQNTAGLHQWFNASSGTAGNTVTFSERMRIDSSGNVGINVASPADKLDVFGTIKFETNTDVNPVLRVGATNGGSGTIGCYSAYFGGNPNNTTASFFKGFSSTSTNRISIWSNGNIQNSNNSYGALSDEKLKENIVDATPKLAELLQVKVRNYNLKYDPEHKQIGVIAQELEQLFPSMIDETSDIDMEGNDLGTTTKAVKYSVFVPMLIKAIQEQQTLIVSQSELITNLTARVTALEAK
jgi:hypothetical protein